MIYTLKFGFFPNRVDLVLRQNQFFVVKTHCKLQKNLCKHTVETYFIEIKQIIVVNKSK